jgi:uncharacterized protein with GYD domain
MATYASLVRIQQDFQNLQELAVIWQEVEAEMEDFDAELLHSYAVLGEFDFLTIFEAPDSDAAFQVSLTMQRNGLDLQTVEIVTTNHFASLVEDL